MEIKISENNRAGSINGVAALPDWKGSQCEGAGEWAGVDARVSPHPPGGGDVD